MGKHHLPPPAIHLPRATSASKGVTVTGDVCTLCYTNSVYSVMGIFMKSRLSIIRREIWQLLQTATRRAPLLRLRSSALRICPPPCSDLTLRNSASVFRHFEDVVSGTKWPVSMLIARNGWLGWILRWDFGFRLLYNRLAISPARLLLNIRVIFSVKCATFSTY